MDDEETGVVGNESRHDSLPNWNGEDVDAKTCSAGLKCKRAFFSGVVKSSWKSSSFDLGRVFGSMAESKLLWNITEKVRVCEPLKSLCST